MFGLNAQTIATVLSIVIIAGFLAYKELRQWWLVKKYGLENNPRRCEEHRDAINELREDVKSIKKHLDIV
jgi:hypothetical protein